MIKKLLLFSVILISQNIFSNSEPILITESTIKLGFDQTQVLFYSFAEGDEIVFNFEMIKGKHIKEVQIIELPSNLIFAEFKAQNISDKKIKVKNKGVYAFRFYSSSLSNRVCRIKISRIPAIPSTENFNTNWKWRTLTDTVYTPYTIDSIIGYNIIKYKERVRELIKTEKIEELLLNKTQRVHSYWNENNSHTYLKVGFPNPILTDLKEEKVIAWAYWIGVGEEAQQAYKENASSVGNLAKGITSLYGTPLAGFAIGTISELIIPKTGEDVAYWFIPDYENVQKFVNREPFLQFDKGKGIAAYGKNTNKIQDIFYIGLHNDNNYQGINVEVKIVVVKEIKIFENREYEREKQEPIIVILHKTRMNINQTKIRVPVD